MAKLEKIAQGIFFPGISSRRYRLWALVGVGVIQSGLMILLFSVTSPLRAFVAAVAIPGAITLLFLPRLGVYILVACVIGQWPWNIMRYILMLVAASTLLWLLLHRKPLFPYNPILILVGVYLLFTLASTINPLSRFEMWSGAAAYIGHFILVWVVITLITSRQSIQRVIGLMIFSGVVTAVVGLIQARTHFIWPASTTYYEMYFNSSFLQEKSAMELQGWMGEFRIDSITGTPDHLALYFQTLIPFVGFWLARQQSRVRQLMGFSTLLLFGVVHLLSFTRGAIVTTVVVLALIGWMIDKRRFVAFGPTLVLVGFLALLLWAPTRERILSMLSPSHTVGTDAHLEPMKWRILTLPVGVQMLFERPLLGIGVGQQPYNWPVSARSLIPDIEKPVPIHNSYLQAGIEMGLGGLVVLLILMAVTVRHLRSLIKRFQLVGEEKLADIARASLIALIGMACAMVAYPMLETFRYFWLMFGVTGALMRIERSLQLTSFREGIHEANLASIPATLRN